MITVNLADLVNLDRAPVRDAALEDLVDEIIADVRARGDDALLESARRFDAPEIASIHVTQEELDAAMPPVPHTLALDASIRRVIAFHSDQLAAIASGWRVSEFESPRQRQRDGQSRHHTANYVWDWRSEDAKPAWIGQRMTPMRSAGVYVPGGRATYPSSVIMNAVPAQVAGVNRITMTTPARPDGTVTDAVLYAARYCGVANVVKVGGAAAIAALALGTESISRVDKIVGPGNRYVNEAKRQLWGSVGVDGYAGPSEVAVVVDSATNARWAAADLLTQIEHAPDNRAYLIAIGASAALAVRDAIESLVREAHRGTILREALTHAIEVIVADTAEALAAIDLIAPEHLSIAIRDAESLANRVRNAGAVLVGESTPESAGDFVAGPSHTLPTAGAARFQNPVNVLDFLKLQSRIELDPETLAHLTPLIETFAEMEGFPMHGYGATIRRPD